MPAAGAGNALCMLVGERNGFVDGVFQGTDVCELLILKIHINLIGATMAIAVTRLHTLPRGRVIDASKHRDVVPLAIMLARLDAPALNFHTGSFGAVLVSEGAVDGATALVHVSCRNVAAAAAQIKSPQLGLTLPSGHVLGVRIFQEAVAGMRV